MKYQRKLHDAFGARKVPAQVRRIAQGVAMEADEEIERLQERVNDRDREIERMRNTILELHLQLKLHSGGMIRV